MAALGEAKEGSFCARCFAHLSGEQPYCPECGAPTGDTTLAAESAGHGELAQANVLRLRGDLNGSEKALLGVLRRYPNDPHAHEMLGDVCAERGELDRAVEWYELALDLAPSSADMRRKLDETRERLETREIADTAETLGLPTARPSYVWWPIAASAAMLTLAILVAAWPRSAAPKTLRATVAANAPAELTASTDTTPPAVTPAPVPTPALTGTEEDRKLLEALQGRAGAVRVQTVTLDPRTQSLAVTFEVREGDDPKAAALALGKEALAVAPTAMTTSLRAVHADRLVFAADLARSAMESADPLTNVWPVPETGTPPATTGSTDPVTAEPGGGTSTGPAPSGTTTPPGTTAGVIHGPVSSG